MKNRIAVPVLIALSLTLILGVSTQVQAETYRIASSLAITGPTSDVGSPYAKGIEDYVQYRVYMLSEKKVEFIFKASTQASKVSDFLPNLFVS